MTSTSDTTPRPGGSPRSVRNNVAYSIVGTVVYSLCLWGMMVVLARVDGSGSLIGRFAIAMALCLPVQMFFNLQLRAVLATDARRQFRFADYFTLRLLSLPPAFLVIGLIVLVGPYDGATAGTILAVALVKAIDAVSDCFQALFQQRERMDLTALSMVVRGLVALGALATGLAVSGSLTVGVLAMAGALAVELVVIDWPMARWLLRRPDPAHPSERPVTEQPFSARRALLGERLPLSRLRPLVWMAMPLGFWALLGALVQFIPQYTIDSLLGHQQLGVFMTMYSVIVAASTLLAAIGEAVVPRLARRIAEGDRSGFLALNLKFVGLVGALCAALVGGIALFGRPFLAIVYGSSYAEHAPTFTWLGLAGAVALVAGSLSSSVLAARRFRTLLMVTLAVAATSAILNGLFVARHGLFGTVYAMAGIAAVTLAIYGVLLVSIVRQTGPSPRL